MDSGSKNLTNIEWLKKTGAFLSFYILFYFFMKIVHKLKLLANNFRLWYD